MVMWS